MRISDWSSDVCSSGLQAFEPLAGPVEDVAECPEQIFEIGLEPGILQRGDQRVEHVGDRAAGDPRFGQRTRIGFVVERAVTVEGKLVEQMAGGGHLTDIVADVYVVTHDRLRRWAPARSCRALPGDFRSEEPTSEL